MRNSILENANLQRIIIAIVLYVIVFTYSMSNLLFYFNWLFGLLIILYFFYLLALKRVVIENPLKKTFLFLIFWTLYPLALTFNPIIIDKKIHITYILLIIFYVTVSLIICYFLKKSKEQVLSIVYWLNSIWIIVNFVFLILYLLNIVVQGDNFSGIYTNRNSFAITTTILISFMIFFRKYYKRKYKNINLLIIIAFTLIVITLSLKGLIGILFICFSYIIFTANKKRKIVLIGLLLILISGVIIIPNPIGERIDRFVMALDNPEQLRKSESAYLRLYFIDTGTEVIKKHPLTGVGIYNSKYYLIPPKSENEIGTYSHNNYIEILIGGGFITFLLYYTPLLILMIAAIRKIKKGLPYIYILTLVSYKLMMDFAMVNYFDFMFIFVLTGSFYYVFLEEDKASSFFIK